MHTLQAIRSQLLYQRDIQETFNKGSKVYKKILSSNNNPTHLERIVAGARVIIVPPQIQRNGKETTQPPCYVYISTTESDKNPINVPHAETTMTMSIEMIAVDSKR